MGRRIAIDPLALGQHLLYWRTIHNWTPEELAALCRQAQRSLKVPGRPITPAWIRLMERGADGLLASINYSHLEALAMAFEIPVTSLTATGLAIPRPERVVDAPPDPRSSRNRPRNHPDA